MKQEEIDYIIDHLSDDEKKVLLAIPKYTPITAKVISKKTGLPIAQVELILNSFLKEEEKGVDIDE